MLEAPVVMVTMDVPAPPGIVGGVKLQPARAGRPLLESLTPALKPFAGVNAAVVVALEPATTVSGDSGAAEKIGSRRVCGRGFINGLHIAELLMARFLCS